MRDTTNYGSHSFSAIVDGSYTLSSLSPAFSSSALHWASKDILQNLLSSGLTLPSNSTPVFSNASGYFPFSQDRPNRFTGSDVSPLLKGAGESTPAHVLSSYWLSYWGRANSARKYGSASSSLANISNFYLPGIVEYAEYDFKNWQSLCALEDAVWETSHPSFLHEEYASLVAPTPVRFSYANQIAQFNSLCRHLAPKPRIAESSACKAPFTTPSPTVYLETFTRDLSTVNLVNFSQFYNLSKLDLTDDAYEGFKSSVLIAPVLLKSYFQLRNTALPTFSYATNLNMFQADFDESSWYTEDELIYSSENALQSNNQFFLSNPIKLRSTVKNLMVTYGAIQKVYRSRFDEGRSNMHISSIHNSYTPYPLLTEARSNYESMVAKNKESYFSASLFNTRFAHKFSDLNVSSTANSSLFLDAPFLLSLKSDPSRYLWFDWLSRWTSIEVQPSSIAKYSLAGLPYAARLYEFASQLGDELGDSENYLSKMYHARRNYVQDWSTASYFYLKTSSWFRCVPQLYDSFNLAGSAVHLIFSSSYSNAEYYVDSVSKSASPSFSGLNKLNGMLYTPSFEIANCNYVSSTLIDLLSKREHFHRLFVASKAHVVGLPDSFVATPMSKLLLELQSALRFAAPAQSTLGYGYNQFISNRSRTNSTLPTYALDLGHSASSFLPANLARLDALLSSSRLSASPEKLIPYAEASSATSSLKSQYRPMRKGVTNMVRLQATNAVAMPTEMRLHILASSKDVIHS